MGKKSAYINMIVCHALAQNDELTYNKFMRKMANLHKQDKKDKIAARLVTIISNFEKRQGHREVSFGEIRNLVVMR